MVDDNKSPRSRMRRDPALAAHRAAVANTLTWAEEAAARGDYVNALAWLSVLNAIRETLPEEYEVKRLDWRRVLVERHGRNARHYAWRDSVATDWSDAPRLPTLRSDNRSERALVGLRDAAPLPGTQPHDR